MLLLVIITMVVTAGLALIPGGLGLSQSYHDKRMALLAADAGQQYAQTRLQQNANWRGNGIPDLGKNGAAQVQVNTPDFYVVEDRGNVVGWLKGPYGTVGQFRIRFNWQDGNGATGDNLNNPNTYTIQNEYVSINNLNGAGSRDVPRASTGGSWSVGGSPAVPYKVAPNAACIIVEGRSGLGLRDIDAANPNMNPATGRSVATFVSECTYARDLSDLADAALYAAGPVDADTRAVPPNPGDKVGFELASEVPNKDPRIRGLNDVTVHDGLTGVGLYTAPANAVVHVPTGNSFKVGSANGPGVNYVNSSLPQLSWNDIRKADGTEAMVRAGLYVWRVNGADRYLEYYATNFDPNVDAIPAAGADFAPGISPTRIDTASEMDISGNDAVIPDTAPFEIQFTKDTLVQPQGAVSDFAVVPDPAVTTSQNRPTIVVDDVDPTGASAAPVLTATGNISFIGELTGEGAVTSEGDITFQGPSALEAQAWDGVAVYAKGDINLIAIPDDVVAGITTFVASNGNGKGKGKGKGQPTIPNPTLKAQDVTLKGVVYTQKDFNIDLVNGVTNQGFFDFTGVLVAYGADPYDNSPNGSTGGVNMNVRGAKITYSDKYLNQLQVQNVPLGRKMSVSH